MCFIAINFMQFSYLKIKYCLNFVVLLLQHKAANELAGKAAKMWITMHRHQTMNHANQLIGMVL